MTRLSLCFPAQPSPETMTREWEGVGNVCAREMNLNPITGGYLVRFLVLYVLLKNVLIDSTRV